MKRILLSVQLFFVAASFIVISFTWQGNVGFGLSDEGYLWYGAQRVMHGEVPLRDFMSYDPGRYYWSAAFMSLWNDDGIMSLRASVAIFQMIGLFIGLLLIACSSKKQNIFYAILSAATLMAWMYPRHKLFDISLSILLIGALAFLVENPTSRRYFIAGLCIGFAAFFGRNHGLYGVAGSFGTMVWLSINRAHAGPGLIRGLYLWAVGVVLGYMPIPIMALLVPGFTNAFWESIRFLFEIKGTNLPLPIPWPWTVNFASVTLGQAIQRMMIGLFFIAIIIFGILSITYVIYKKIYKQQVPSILVATAFLSFPYAHHAFSRAAVSHLAQGIFPMLIAVLSIFSRQIDRIKWPSAIIFCFASLWVMHLNYPGWQCHSSNHCVNIEISKSHLLVGPRTAANIKLIQRLVNQFAPSGQTFIAAPFWPGAYALFGRKSPMWEIYPIWKRSQSFEQSEIEHIKKASPAFAIIIDYPIDGRDDLRFSNTHPLINRYIQDHFEKIDDPSNPLYQIYKAKGISSRP